LGGYFCEDWDALGPNCYPVGPMFHTGAYSGTWKSNANPPSSFPLAPDSHTPDEDGIWCEDLVMPSVHCYDVGMGHIITVASNYCPHDANTELLRPAGGLACAHQRNVLPRAYSAYNGLLRLCKRLYASGIRARVRACFGSTGGQCVL
jgi:hypothetical protein